MRALLFLALPLLLTACRCGSDRIVTVTPDECTGPSCMTTPDCVAYEEVCNGLDDDCDGEIDEALGVRACGTGACLREVDACSGGAPATCTAGAPSGEVCNGVDDDCDGAVDEDLLPTTCGVGECEQVAATCDSGNPLSCQPLPPGTETCDGRDNDCDGTVDEDLLGNISSDQRITTNTATSDFVYAGWDGERFALTWQDGRDGTGKKGEIYFVTLDATGARSLASDVRITNTSSVSTHPALDWNGERYGLVYADSADGDFDIFFQSVQADGSLVGAARRITTAAGESDWPDLVWTGQAFGLAWADGRNGNDDLYFRLLAADGTPLSAELQITTQVDAQQSPIIKWNPELHEFGLVWSDLRDGDREIYFRRLDANGAPLGQEIRVTNALGASSWPDLAWSGQEWAIVWQDDIDGDKEIFFARLNGQGASVGIPARLTDSLGFSGYPSIDWNGFQYGISWQDERRGHNDIYFASVNEQGVKNGSDLRISNGSAPATYTTALWNGSTYGFAWRDERDGNSELYFAYVGCP